MRHAPMYNNNLKPVLIAISVLYSYSVQTQEWQSQMPKFNVCSDIVTGVYIFRVIPVIVVIPGCKVKPVFVFID